MSATTKSGKQNKKENKKRDALWRLFFCVKREGVYPVGVGVPNDPLGPYGRESESSPVPVSPTTQKGLAFWLWWKLVVIVGSFSGRPNCSLPN